MYALKNLLGVLGNPLLLALLLGVAAVAARTRGRRRVAISLSIAAVAVGCVGSIEWTGDVLLYPLERQYPPLSQDATPAAVGYVVVLGSGYSPHDGIPITAALDREGLVRIVEGVRLIRLLGNAHLVVSGGAPPGQTPPALGYARLARSLGVAEAAIISSDRALDTNSEAHDVVALLGAAPFLLVTSASHMPRAMRLMQLAGAHPIAAPTGQQANGSGAGGLHRWIPAALGLRKTEQSLHEYMGLAALTVGIR